MTATSNPTRNLRIDGMTGEPCVQKVTGALRGVKDVSTQSVRVGTATITADQTGCNAACAAIGHAGYKAREDNTPAPTGARAAEHTLGSRPPEPAPGAAIPGGQPLPASPATPPAHHAGAAQDPMSANAKSKPPGLPN